METFEIFFAGAGAGIIFSVVCILLINTQNAEQYPLGGFMPALMMVAEWGVQSKIMVAGILIMGGMTGYFLILTIWKRRPDTFVKNSLQKTQVTNNPNLVAKDKQSTIIIKGKSLAKFL